MLTILASVLAWFMSIWHKLESLDRRGPQLRKCLNKIWLYAGLQGILLISEWWGRMQSIVGNASPVLVILDSKRRQIEQSIENKTVGHGGVLHGLSISFCLHVPDPAWIPCLTSFDDEHCCGKGSQKYPFLNKLFWLWCFTTEIETVTKTAGMRKLFPRSFDLYLLND